MKKQLLFAVLLCVGALSCTKNTEEERSATVEETTANVIAVYSGNFQFAAKQGSGKVVIYKKDSGTLSVGLEGMSLGSETHYKVMLASSATEAGIKLFSVAGLSGNSQHDIPSSCDFKSAKFILIQREPSEELVASAELK